MLYCMKCGVQLQDGSNFCHYCGSDINAQRQSVVREECPDELTVAVADAAEPSEIKADFEAFRVQSAPENASTYVVSVPVTRVASTEEERQRLLDTVRKKLIGEKRIWRAGAIVCIVAYVLCIFLAITSFVSLIMYPDGSFFEEEEYYYGVDVEHSSDEEELTTEDIYSIVFALSWMGCVYGIYTFIPCAVFGFILSSKAGKVQRTLYTDCSNAYRRCKSPTIIIFAAIFNPFALIFTIPLFSIAKNNGPLFSEITNIQHNYFG